MIKFTGVKDKNRSLFQLVIGWEIRRRLKKKKKLLVTARLKPTRSEILVLFRQKSLLK